jgi:hypothetical protein
MYRQFQDGCVHYQTLRERMGCAHLLDELSGRAAPLGESSDYVPLRMAAASSLRRRARASNR